MLRSDPLQTVSSPPFAVAGLVTSMGLMAVGNGLLFAYIPVRLATTGHAPWVAGAIVTAFAAGSLIGCFVTGPVVRAVGHARAFACLAALVILSGLAICIGTEPAIWIPARVLYGVASSGLFIVVQSWLNDACDNRWRGRVIALFYMTYIIALGAGAFLLRFVSLDGLQAPLLSIFFATLSILPACMTRLRTPPPPQQVAVALRAVWRISPVGLVGLFAVGGLTMLVQGFAPIYAAARGFAKDDIALLMFLMQFGMIGVQLPLGALSDRVDRRYVLIAACLIVVAGAAVAAGLGATSLALLIPVFAVWSGATESIYAIANAHANDRADPDFYVSLSSTLLVAWSVSACVLPGVATLLTPLLGPAAFMYLAMAIAAAYGAFVAWRLTRSEPAPRAELEPYQPMSAQAPLTPELAPLATDPDDRS